MPRGLGRLRCVFPVSLILTKRCDLNMGTFLVTMLHVFCGVNAVAVSRDQLCNHVFCTSIPVIAGDHRC